MRVGAVDIGTNSVRILVSEHSTAGVTNLARVDIVTRLGQAVDASGDLHPDAVDRTLRALREHGETARSFGVERLAAVATSAVRDAGGREAFLDSALDALGVRPEVISGEREAQLSFLGVRMTVTDPPPLLVVDPGGGSTEFVLGEDRPDYSVSVDIGSVRLTERLLPDRPASDAEMAAARSHVDELLADVELPRQPATVVGVGGTFTNLAAILLGLNEYDSARVHGSRFVLEDIIELTTRLQRMTRRETEAIPSLDPARAAVFLAGAVVVERALAKAEAATVVVSDAGILDGVASELAAGSW